MRRHRLWIDLVKQRYAEGYSMRQIAKDLGLSRFTVHKIVTNKYTRTKEELTVTGRDFIAPLSTDPRLVRCGGCGGRVLPPCSLCQTREIKQQKRKKK